MEDNAKIYGLCLMRLRHQISLAKQRQDRVPADMILECYNTGEIDEIIDLLEIYDLDDRSDHALRLKLEDLSLTVSMLTRETLYFDYTDKGHLGLFIELKKAEDQSPGLQQAA